MERPNTAESELPAAYYILNLRLVWLTEYHYTYSDDSNRSISSPKPTGPLSVAQHGCFIFTQIFSSQEMVSTRWQNMGSSASILGIALMTADWMGEQQWS